MLSSYFPACRAKRYVKTINLIIAEKLSIISFLELDYNRVIEIF